MNSNHWIVWATIDNDMNLATAINVHSFTTARAILKASGNYVTVIACWKQRRDILV